MQCIVVIKKSSRKSSRKKKIRIILASYRDLKKQTYDEIRTRPFTRIHGRPTWRLKGKLVEECKEIALNYDVGYDWSGGYGLLPEIVGAARFAADIPLLPAYIPPNAPSTRKGTGRCCRDSESWWERTSGMPLTLNTIQLSRIKSIDI